MACSRHSTAAGQGRAVGCLGAWAWPRARSHKGIGRDGCSRPFWLLKQPFCGPRLPRAIARSWLVSQWSAHDGGGVPVAAASGGDAQGAFQSHNVRDPCDSQQPGRRRTTTQTGPSLHRSLAGKASPSLLFFSWASARDMVPSAWISSIDQKALGSWQERLGALHGTQSALCLSFSSFRCSAAHSCSNCRHAVPKSSPTACAQHAARAWRLRAPRAPAKQPSSSAGRAPCRRWRPPG